MCIICSSVPSCGAYFMSHSASDPRISNQDLSVKNGERKMARNKQTSFKIKTIKASTSVLVTLGGGLFIAGVSAVVTTSFSPVISTGLLIGALCCEAVAYSRLDSISPEEQEIEALISLNKAAARKQKNSRIKRQLPNKLEMAKRQQASSFIKSPHNEL
jgi:hypothetical protein